MERKEETGILLVSFGTSYRETRERNIDRLAKEIAGEYPHMPVYQAFSSGKVIDILKKRDGMLVHTVQEALQRMKQDGLRRVLVQPTHIINGIETKKVRDSLEEYKNDFCSLVMGRVLLDQAEDYERAAAALWQELAQEVGQGSLILMGHGTRDEADQAYARLEQTFHKQGHQKVYVATVEGRDRLERALAKLDSHPGRESKRVVLAPFMLVAGDHAVNDMAGEQDSFAVRTAAAGWEPQCILKGLAEYEGIRALYLEHLREDIKHVEL